MICITNSVYIPSIDAKDLYLSNNNVDDNKNKQGYDIHLRDGTYNLKKFINTLDYSLDLIKLREVYQKVYRKSGFSFYAREKEYTCEVVNVTFKYSVKTFNKVYSDKSKCKDIYVRTGYEVSPKELIDNIIIRDNMLIAIRVNSTVEEPVSDLILGENFYFDGGVYKAKSNIKTLKTVAELRHNLYENGFYLNGVHYVRFKRSSGSSRIGKCLFIDEHLYYRMHKWEDCGVGIEKIKNPDLAAYEAYIALTLSSIIDTVQLEPKNILLIDDFESKFIDSVIATRYEDNKLVSKEEDVEVVNSIWDGQSLLDVSVFGAYRRYGMLLLRNRFFKSCCFNTNIQQFFRDNNITDVKQLNGVTRAECIEDIKLITTPSSIKYLKFGSFDQWLDNLDTIFGVVKHEKPTHYFEGRMVQTHYQLLNTLQMTMQEVKEFLSQSFEFIQQVYNDPAVLRYYISYQNSRFSYEPVNTKFDVIYKLMGVNDIFSLTKTYYDFKTSLIKSIKKNMRKGHILVDGNYSTLTGNPYEMLLSSIGKFDGKSILGIGNIHNKRFEYGKVILGSRSPHTVIGNVYLPMNKADENIDRYFNLSNEIVCINSIEENTLQKLSGCD